LNLDYDDLILFSEVDEIPPIFDVTEMSKFLIFEPIAFLQKNFSYSTEYINVEPHLGTFCFTYSQFITDEILIETLYFNKNAVNSIYYRIIEGGYHFSQFQTPELITKKYNLLNDNVISLQDVDLFVNELKYWDREFTNFINYDGELPKNLDIIPKNFFGKIKPKKFLVIFNFNQNFIDESNLTGYTSILNINFTKSYHYPSKNELSPNFTNYNVYIPETDYYVSEKFELEFAINEIKNILKTNYPLNHDQYEFCVCDENSSLKDFKKFEWSRIKEGYLYDLIKNPS